MILIAAGWAAKKRLQDLLSVEVEAEDLARLIDGLLRRNRLNAMQAGNQFHELVANLKEASPVRRRRVR